ncbi:CynX/NimT family MFS transporter [Pseudokineococcus lusitanus]|uniref:CP family cyanate transporter-like MFS transporter n=1 Tax=Pseudokineococcus lusitanus TaxID=763993 RepID=A0A3N1HJT3_9ACTN|nr:MFS transporter [Pseudokineococcus lusitanus]ROP42766.1 CP family cyanate transporter-like MFS transporter [Pseudokineococcus lusitanus]
MPVTSRPAPGPALVVAAVVVVALSLRGPLVAVAPVLEQVRADLGLTPTTAGLLTTVPVVCFAVASPLASVLLARLGPAVAVWCCLAGVAAGTVLRSVGDQAVALVATVVIGVAITIGNITLPVVVRRAVPPARWGAATGAYTAALNSGSVITSLGTEPLAAWLGWRPATAVWLVLVLAGALLWAAVVVGRPGLPAGPGTRPTATAGAAPARRRPWVSVALGVGFGAQAGCFYGLTAWLPTLLADRNGLSPTGAGAASSVFHAAAIVGALLVPLVLHRRTPRATAGLLAACWLVLPVGMLLAPAGWPVWTSLGGAAQGGVFTLVVVLLTVLADDDDDARRSSALVQGLGYTLAALGPTVLGAVHAATDGWDEPLLLVLGALLVMVVAVGAPAHVATQQQRAAREPAPSP